jgi:hypothetical protein
MYIVLTVHLDFICIKLFWILTPRQWHPHPTTGQVLQSSSTPDLISEEEEEEEEDMHVLILESANFVQTTKIGIHEFKRIHNDDRPLYHFFPFLISLH